MALESGSNPDGGLAELQQSLLGSNISDEAIEEEEYRTIVTRVSEELQQLEQLTRGLSQQGITTEGTAYDTSPDRAIQLANSLKNELELLSSCSSSDTINAAEKRKRRFQQKSFSKQLMQLCQAIENITEENLRRAQTSTTTSHQHHIVSISSSADVVSSTDSNASNSLQQQQQQVPDNYLEDLNREDAIAREAELRRISESAVKVNEIFRDIATLVEEQAEQVDTIEMDVETAHERTESALEQLNRALKKQKVSASRLVKGLAGFLVTIIVVLLLSGQL